MMEIRKVAKQKSKLRIGLSGTSGSGKTYSALLLASGLASWDKVCIIDTENGSADLYEDLGEYNVIPLLAPYKPERYIEAIKSCEEAGMEVIIIDSITHEWDGEGGCLEIVDQLGGKYQDWGKVTPRHQKFINTILQSKCHILTTVRRKQDYEMIKVGDRTKVEKKGLKEITREGFEYELTLNFNIEQNHLATASKDRTGMFMDQPEFIITAGVGKRLKDWAEKGKDLPTVEQDRIRVKKIFALAKQVYPDKTSDEVKEKIKTHFNKSSFTELSNSELEEVIKGYETKLNETK